MKKSVLIVFILFTSILYADWIFGPETFEDATTIINGSYGSSDYWFAPDYSSPLYVYSPGFASDSCIGSGEISWPDWWGNFIRTPMVDCSSADSVILNFRIWNSGDPYDQDNARFYIWVEPDGYMGDTTISLSAGYEREWELLQIDFTEYAAGENQVYFYLETNFGTGSFTRECKFDNIGVVENTILNTNEKIELPEKMDIQIYPNPFNSKTNIAVSSMGQKIQKIFIYDQTGRFVEELNNPFLKVNGSDNFGNDSIHFFSWSPNKNLDSGIYLITFKTKNCQISRKIIYTK